MKGNERLLRKKTEPPISPHLIEYKQVVLQRAAVGRREAFHLSYTSILGGGVRRYYSLRLRDEMLGPEF